MATFTLTTTPGAAYLGSEADDTFVVPSLEAWLASGRTINGMGGRDLLLFQFDGAVTEAEAAQRQITDLSFAGVSNLEAVIWSPLPFTVGGLLFSMTMGPTASAAFPTGASVGGSLTLFGQGLTVAAQVSQTGRASAPISIATGLANDQIFSDTFAVRVDAGPGDDRITLRAGIGTPFEGTGMVAGGAGYDILVGFGFGSLFATVTALASGTVSGIEEIWTSARFNLLAETPTALTGLDANGNRNPLVLRPDDAALNIYASDDGRASYDGRIQAYGTGAADTVRGSSTGDFLEGGGGADNLSGEGGNDWLVFQNTAQLAAAASVAGGAGYDILALKDAGQNVTDAAFANLSGIEELRLLGGGVHAVFLGANSDAAFRASSFGAGSVSAPGAERLIVNAAGSNTALSIYGATFTSIRASDAADYIEISQGGGSSAILAGGGADHVRFNAIITSMSSVNGGAGYDVLMLNDVALSGLSAQQPFPFFAPNVSGFEELRIMGSGAISVTLTDRFPGAEQFGIPPSTGFIFGGSETGYGTIQAPNAASLAMNLRALTVGISLYGTPGADVITATATANDYLFGGAGADQFRFDRQCSVDVVADFVSGTDKLAVVGFAGITDFAAVQARAAILNGNLQISLTPTDGIILAGVTSIADGDFLFS